MNERGNKKTFKIQMRTSFCFNFNQARGCQRCQQHASQHQQNKNNRRTTTTISTTTMTMAMPTMAMTGWKNAVVAADDHHQRDRDRDQPPYAANGMKSTGNQATNGTTTKATAATNVMATAWLFWGECQLATASGSLLGTESMMRCCAMLPWITFTRPFLCCKNMIRCLEPSPSSSSPAIAAPCCQRQTLLTTSSPLLPDSVVATCGNRPLVRRNLRKTHNWMELSGRALHDSTPQQVGGLYNPTGVLMAEKLGKPMQQTEPGSGNGNWKRRETNKKANNFGPLLCKHAVEIQSTINH